MPGELFYSQKPRNDQALCLGCCDAGGILVRELPPMQNVESLSNQGLDVFSKEQGVPSFFQVSCGLAAPGL